MKTERNILIAFILNLSFSVFEFIGGIFTGSVAIVSDAVHDLGDATSIGVSYFLERKSRQHPDENFTYGYIRYSLIGGFITTLILLIGSIFMIYNAVSRIITPVSINYDGMIVFALIGVVVNFCAALVTHRGDSLNQRAVNLHMLEDVLGWVVVLSGSLIMRFTDFYLIDPIMSVCVSLFIIYNALENLKYIADLFLLKTPSTVSVSEIKDSISSIDGIIDVHHIHVWSIDGHNNVATLHIVTDDDSNAIKYAVKKQMHILGVEHVTVEVETNTDICPETECHINIVSDKHKVHTHSHS